MHLSIKGMLTIHTEKVVFQPSLYASGSHTYAFTRLRGTEGYARKMTTTR